MLSDGGGIISESGGDYFSELGGEIISESGGGLPRNLQSCRGSRLVSATARSCGADLHSHALARCASVCFPCSHGHKTCRLETQAFASPRAKPDRV
ncbi:hypothetical protein SMRU11_21720 [Sinorhizobium meliloti RU11/001]|nr:hypothetical protein SMRU11_21720 [Sinorhizobium meliloti RU11/001]